jgi:cytochrome c556
MTKTLIAGALAATVALAAGVAVAATPAETATARQNNFKQMGRASKAIGDEFKKPAPDVAVFRAQAQVLANLAPQVHRWFPRGTGVESGAKTGALPAIWQQTPLFNTKANQFVAAARNFQRAAAGGNVAQIRAAFPAVGGSCKGCHDTFKGDK